jgi:AcrR family transcriptional regulator
MAVDQASVRRRTRETDLVKATRQLFDQRGMQDAPIEEIARSVGIARGLIYRHFSSKEELFVLTVTDYLADLAVDLDGAIDPADPPDRQLERCAEAFAGFCSRYPAFLDSTTALMRRPAKDLSESISESVWLRLGQGMSGCLEFLSAVLRRGVQAGAFAVADPDRMANFLWAQMLGAMHLVRLRVGVREAPGGAPELFTLTSDEIVAMCVASVRATVAPVDSSS